MRGKVFNYSTCDWYDRQTVSVAWRHEAPCRVSRYRPPVATWANVPPNWWTSPVPLEKMCNSPLWVFRTRKVGIDATAHTSWPAVWLKYCSWLAIGPFYNELPRPLDAHTVDSSHRFTPKKSQNSSNFWVELTGVKWFKQQWLLGIKDCFHYRLCYIFLRNCCYLLRNWPVQLSGLHQGSTYPGSICSNLWGQVVQRT